MVSQPLKISYDREGDIPMSASVNPTQGNHLKK